MNNNIPRVIPKQPTRASANDIEHSIRLCVFDARSFFRNFMNMENVKKLIVVVKVDRIIRKLLNANVSSIFDILMDSG